MTGAGQTASNQVGAAGAAAASAIGNAQIANGGNQAAAIIGKQNNINDTVGSLYSMMRNRPQGGVTPNTGGLGGYDPRGADVPYGYDI
jgi:hypothetical protein